MASSRRNDKDSESFLFRGLTKLFSGPITNYRQQTPRQLKRNQLDRFQFKSASGQRFRKSQSKPLENIYGNARGAINRSERYIDFEQMEMTAELAAALDVYAAEMTMSSPLQKLLNIDCHNEEIKNVLENLYYNVLNIEFSLFGICRSMCKFGDHFAYLDIDDKLGVTSMLGLPPQEIERLEGEDPTNANYVQYQWNSAGLTLENWQLAHFRILGNDKFAPYGMSIFDPVRRVWRQLDLQEQAMMAYRIVRSPERRVFYVDTAGLGPKEVEPFMEQLITDMKRNQVVDPTTGQIDLRYDAFSIEEDYYIPVSGPNSGTRVESLPGGAYTGDIDDVKYLRDKMLSGLKIPHAYLVAGDAAVEDKTTLAQKDIQFARTIQRLQRSVVSELEKIGHIHLFVLGYRGKDLTSFKLALANPSKIGELMELEHMQTKFNVASAATEGFYSRRSIAKKVLGMSDEEFLRNIREMYFDAELSAKLEEIATVDEGDMGGDMGGDFDGDLDGDGDADLEDDVLLAEPGEEAEIPAGKRHDIAPMKEKGYVTARSKGKVYEPVTVDKRPSGARKRSMKSKYSDESARNTPRNVFKGGSELRTLARGVFENYESNYRKIMNEQNDVPNSELQLSKEDVDSFSNEASIDRLIESLSKDEQWKEKVNRKPLLRRLTEGSERHYRVAGSIEDDAD